MLRGSENPAVHAEGTQSAAASAVAAARRRASTRELSPLARAIAAEPISHAISPVVLIGFVQAIEFLLMVAAGGAVYATTAYPVDGFDWRYVFADLGVAVAAIIAFSTFEIYSTAAFRTHVHQRSRLGLAWTLVFLLAIAVSFFVKFNDTFSRSWAAGWYLVAIAALFADRLGFNSLGARGARRGGSVGA